MWVKIKLCVDFLSLFFLIQGGMKAVVWTDAVQTFIMVLGVAVGALSALIFAGGFGEVFRLGKLYERTKLIK